ncbi:MAG: hypothetical protein ACO1SX_10630 [Actinomycetota bacterium]
MLLLALGVILAVAAIAAGTVIVVSAFQEATWKGLACLCCGWYLTYYTWVEFDHEYRSLIVTTTVFGAAAAGVLISIGSGMVSG